MLCRDVQKILNSRTQMDEELPRMAEEHLRTCAQCQSENDMRQALAASLRDSVRRITVPASLDSSICRRLRHQNTRIAAPRMQWMMALAATLAIAGGLALVWKPQFASVNKENLAFDVNTSELLRVGLDEHIHCKHGKEYTFQPNSVEKLRAQLGLEFADFLQSLRLAQPDIRILQAHRCSYQNRHFTHVVLEDHDKAVSVLLMPQYSTHSGKYASQLIQATTRNVSVALLEGKKFVSYVVSDLSPVQNRQLASEIEPALKKYTQSLSA